MPRDFQTLLFRLIKDVLERLQTPASKVKLGIQCWLFNPFTITISTRGSGEALVAVQILCMLRCLLQGKDIYLWR